MSLSLIRKWFGRQVSTSPRRSPARFRPQLECLEARTLLNATIYVNAADAGAPIQDGSQAHPYGTIQQGVNAATPGTVIQVAPGTYNEQVTISGASKTNVTLEGAGKNTTFIDAPAVLTGNHATVEVTGTKGVTVANFTIENSSPNSNNGGQLYGVLIDGGASATVYNNHITQVEDTPLDGVQEGIAVAVGSSFLNTTGSATVSHNIIDNYQKAGIDVQNSGSSAQIIYNTVTGVGSTNQIAQNGIEIDYGATGKVSYNTVSDNLYAGPNTATGILLFESGSVTVNNNTLSNNDVGIYVYYPYSQVTLNYNQVTGSTYDGIVLFATYGAQLNYNRLGTNGSGNVGDGGIALYYSSGNTIYHNLSMNNNGDGIYVDPNSTNNTFTQNNLNGNTNFDAQDTSTGSGTDGTANTWTNNRGATSSPPGLVS